MVGEAVVQNGSAELKVSGLEVKAGDTLDFIADCRANSNSDSFNWAPKLKFTDVMKRTKQAPPGGFEVEWDAKADFTKHRSNWLPGKSSRTRCSSPTRRHL
jgi:hypothetical protein